VNDLPNGWERISYEPLPQDDQATLRDTWANSFLSTARVAVDRQLLLAEFGADRGVDEDGSLWLRLRTGVGITREVEWDGTLRSALLVAQDLGADFGEQLNREELNDGG
jgi:hypothetical protein